MARPKSTADNKRLTPAELQVMQVLWQLKYATTAEVQAELNDSAEREFAYTTVSTMLRVLEKKSAVSSHKQGRGHVYQPELSQQDYQDSATQELVKDLFSGDASMLVKNLLGQAELSAKDIREMRQLLDECDA